MEGVGGQGPVFNPAPPGESSGGWLQPDAGGT
jgi:hypothetical protein